MADERASTTRRQLLTTGAVAAIGGFAGCAGLLESEEGSDEPDDSPAEPDNSGPLRVTGTELSESGGRTVQVAVAIENTGDAARRADITVELSHTEAEGSIDRDRPLLLAAGLEREVVLAFRPQFFGGDGVGRPEDGEFRADARFENVEISENYPGLAAPTERAAIEGGRAWPGVAYDGGATAYNPGTEAPRAAPTADWTAPSVEYSFADSGPVVANGAVVAGRGVRALSVEDGTERWVHDGPARTSPLAAGEGVVAFGTTEDVRALDAEDGTVRWTVPSGDIWDGGLTVADGRVYAARDRIRSLDASSGAERWAADAGGSLASPPPVADGVVLAGGDPLRAHDAEDGAVRWAVAGAEPVVDAAVAYDTAFALTESQLVALDLAEGRTRWFAPGPFEATRIAVGGGSVYAQRADDYRLTSIDAANGNDEWVSGETDGMLGPLSASDGVLVALSGQGTLYGFDAATGETLWSQSVPSQVPGSLAVADGTVYFNEPNGPLRALTDEG